MTGDEPFPPAIDGLPAAADADPRVELEGEVEVGTGAPTTAGRPAEPGAAGESVAGDATEAPTAADVLAEPEAGLFDEPSDERPEIAPEAEEPARDAIAAGESVLSVGESALSVDEPVPNTLGRPSTADGPVPGGERASDRTLTEAPVSDDAPTVAALESHTASVPVLLPIEATPVETAPAGADLVPLTDLAPAISEVSLSRRAFLGFGLTLAGGLAGAGIMTRFVPIFAEPPVEPPPIVRAYDPASKAWTFVVDSASCIGCGLCVVACKAENDVTGDPGFSRTWVERHAVAIDGAVFVDSPAGGADGFPPASTAVGAADAVIDRAFFESRLCMQCENSPCTSVCPVSATYRTAEGIVLVDARRCIGCGYCVVACPYGARYLTPAGPDNPNGTAGVADKCTWCYHRISRGALPACVEVCPVGSRKFGDANDPDSEVGAIVRAGSGRPLHPEYGTLPRVLYLGPATEEA